MAGSTLSPDTDRRFIESVIARKLMDAKTVAHYATEHARAVAAGSTGGSVAQTLCERGGLDRRIAAEILRSVRAERARDSTWPTARDPDPTDAPLPPQLGDYLLERELGRGGMGVVWLARHRATGAVRALKILDVTVDPETVARFRREAEALARVGGEVVVPVHEVGVERGRIFFAMDLMTGGSLRAKVLATGALPWPEAVALALRITRGVERCHAVGLIHRDLKPDNVLLDDQGRPRLADFGVARDLMGRSLTQTGTVLGTPVYMPPEQLDGAKVDARADVYALGALLHELLSGAPPFSGKTLVEVFEAKKRGARTALPEATPPALRALLDRTLAARAEDRPGSAKELGDALEQLIAARPAPPPLARSRIKDALLVVLGVLIGLAVGRGLPSSAERAPAVPVAPNPPAPPPHADRGRLLLEALGAIESSRTTMKDVGASVESARRAGLSNEGCARIVSAIAARTERLAEGTRLLPGPHVAAPAEEIVLLRELAEELGAPILPSDAVMSLMTLYASWRSTQEPPAWRMVFAAALVSMRQLPSVCEGVAIWALNSAAGKDGPPSNAVTVLEAACATTTGDVQQRCYGKFVEFLGITGKHDRMLVVAIEALTASPEGAEHVLHAIQRAHPETLDGEALDRLVSAGRESSEVLLLRAQWNGRRRVDAVTALQKGFHNETDRLTALKLVGTEPSLVRHYVEWCVVKRDRDKAVEGLQASTDDRIRGLTSRLYYAKWEDMAPIIAEIAPP